MMLKRITSSYGARFAFFGWAGFLTENVVLSHNRTRVIESVRISTRTRTFSFSRLNLALLQIIRLEMIIITDCIILYLLLHVCPLRLDCIDIDLNQSFFCGISDPREKRRRFFVLLWVSAASLRQLLDFRFRWDTITVMIVK